jgi:LysM repeat protein
VPYNKPIKNTTSNKIKTNEVTKETKVAKVQNDVAAVEIVKTAPKTFKVEPGMTLFAVATRNKTTVANIKRMNNLKSDVIRPGQILIVKEAEEITKKVPVKPEPKLPAEKVVVKEEAPVIVAKKPIEKEVIVIEKEKTEVPTKATSVIVEKPKVVETKPADMPKPDTAFPKPAVISEPIKAAEQIEEEKERVVKVEEGIAEIIEVESKSGKYLALHKSAPLGTLVQVKNETTNASVWVKVIGRLPGVDQNENVIIKLSPKAMDRVSPIDKRFRAKITYSL